MPYFDHNATTPLCPPAREAWLRVQDRCGTMLRVFTARRRRPATNWTTAANDWPKFSVKPILRPSSSPVAPPKDATASSEPAPIWTSRPNPAWKSFISPYEHPAVREPATRLCGAQAIDRPTLEQLLERRIAPSPRLTVAWMAANNETGELFPMANLGRSVAARRRRQLLSCDASQWFGKLPAEDVANGPTRTTTRRKRP